MIDVSIRTQAARRLLAVCGIAGPIIYAAVVVVLGFLHEGYSHASQPMSELGADGAPYAIVMNTAGLPLLGLSMVAFASGLYLGISNGRGSKTGPALLAVSGAGLALTGAFPCDPACEDVTTVGRLHGAFATTAATAMVLALLAMYARFRRDGRWRSYATCTLATAIVALPLSALYGFDVFEGWRGALQRVSVALPLLWVEVVAVRLLRL